MIVSPIRPVIWPVITNPEQSSGRRSVNANSATYWLFADRGLTGSPWNYLSPGRTGLGTRVDSAGLVGYGPHNLLLNSETLSTQNVTTTAQQYTLKFSGAGTVTLSGTGSGVLSAGTNTFTATAGTLTLTVAGSVSSAQLNIGAVATDYVQTTSAARYLPRLTYNPSTLAAQGVLIEGQATNINLLSDDLTNANWLKQQSTAPTVDTLQEDSTAASLHRIVQPITGASGLPYTFQAWVASGTRVFAQIGMSDNATGSAGYNIDLTTGAASAHSSGSWTGLSDLTIKAMTRNGIPGWFVAFTATKGAGAQVVSQINIATALGTIIYNGNGTGTIRAANIDVKQSAAITSYIPTSTASVTRVTDWTGPGVVLTGAALAAAFPGGVTAPFTGVFKYRKAYSSASDETLFALSAGATFATTNGFALQTNGTQAKLTTSAGDGTVSGTLVHDGATINKIAYSVDPVAGKMSIAVNGAAAVETTGSAYTGAGVTSLIPGAQTTGGLEPVTQMVISEWRCVTSSTYTTGASLQALSA